MRKHSILFTGVLVLTLLMSGCQKKENESDAGTESQPREEAVQEDKTRLGTSLETVDLKGEAVTIDFTGSDLTVINVWATWCPPCIEELPELQQMSQQMTDQKVQVIGVLQDGIGTNGKADEAVIKQGETLLTEAGATYQVVLPETLLTEQLIAKMQYFPTTFFVNAKGEVIRTEIGAKDAKGWSEAVEKTLKELE